MTAICPNSTPTLKDIRLVIKSSSGIPISVMTPAKPNQ